MMTPKIQKKLLKRVQDGMDSWYTSFAENNEHYKFFTKFVMKAEQWSEKHSAGMNQSEIEMFTMNMLKKIANSILGQQQQNTPDLQVIPLCDQAQKNNAIVIQNLLRYQILKSDYKEAEQVEFMCKVVGGYGAIRLDHKFANNKDFKQETCVKPVFDPTHCFWDVNAKESHKGDGMFCGYYESVSKEKYSKIKELKGKEYPSSFSLAQSNINWVNEKSVICVYYYEKKITTNKMYLLDDETTMSEEEYNSLDEVEFIEKPEIIDEREVEDIKVMGYKFIGDYLVEKTEFPGGELPIIFGEGANTFWIDGKQYIQSFFCDAEDAQIYRNYLVSKSADLIKKYNPAQWIGERGNFEGNEEYWKNPSRVTSALPYKGIVDPSTGQTFRPEKVPPSMLPPHFLEQTQLATSDINNIIGVYETQMGAQGNEISGDAIDARSGQGNKNTFVLFNASYKLIARVGYVMYRMIRELKKTKSLETVDSPENGLEQIKINNPVDDYTIENDITTGEYNVVIRAGASFEAQKKQNLELLIHLSQAMGVIQTPSGPFPAAQYFGDIIADNIPLNGANEIKGRLRYALPEAVIAAGKGQKVQPPPPQPNPQEEMMKQKMAAEMKQIDAKNQATQASIVNTQVKSQAEITKAALAVDEAKAAHVTKIHEHHEKRLHAFLKQHEAARKHVSNQY